MTVKAALYHLRIAPRKVRLVADLIRGKELKKAETLLSFTTKRAARPLFKLLKQAEANAKNNLRLDPSNLFISKILINEGPKLKRWRARARGQAYEIQKKTSHIIITLDEIKKTIKKARKIKPKAIEKETEPIVEERKEVKVVQPKKTKFKPEVEIKKPKTERGGVIKKIFRREAFK